MRELFREGRTDMADTYHFDPDDRGTQGSSGQNQQNYNYHYKYSYGSGSGQGTGGGRKPPKNPNDWGEWAGIGLMLFILPFWFCKIIGIVWLIRKLVNMANSGQSDRYRQEARNAANRAKSTAETIFQQTADTARQAADTARQAAADAAGRCLLRKLLLSVQPAKKAGRALGA